MDLVLLIIIQISATYLPCLQETRLLERIQELKINKILPTKIRFLVNVHANSDKLGALLEQMFACIGQIVEAKVMIMMMKMIMIMNIMMIMIMIG